MELLSDRRAFLLRAGLGGAAWALARCGYYPAESGDAYAPWDYPGDELLPERRIARAALLAASPHNTQPWLFELSSTEIRLWADHRQALGPMDPLGRELYLGLGAALENATIAARALGKTPTVRLFPSAEPDHVATIGLDEGSTQGAEPLEPFIAQRRTHRGQYLEGAPLPGLEAALAGLIDDPLVSAQVLFSPEDRSRFMDATVAATEAIVADQEMNEASHRWWRGTRDDLEAYRDGLTPDAAGLDGTLRALGKITTTDAAAAGQYWIDGQNGRQRSCSAVVLLSTQARDDRQQQLRAGRIFQRLHLWATQQGLALQPQNQLPERQDREQQLALEPVFTRALEALVGGPSRVQMVFRLGYSFDEAKRSPRRPLEWVLR